MSLFIGESIQLIENQKMIVQNILEMHGYFYPFDEPINHGSKGMIEQLQRFDSKEQLLQRKNELKKHMKGIQSNHIIKLLKIYEEDLCLHYIYEHVPQSLSTYIKSQLEKDEYDQFKDMTAKLLFKKITNDINSITVQLSKLRTETEIFYQNLGVQGNKVKLFIGTRFQVGRKSELLLKQQYKLRKEIIFKTLQQEILRIVNQAHETPNFVIKGNCLLFSTNKTQKSNPYSRFAPSIYSDLVQSSFCLNDTYVNCETKDSNMNNNKEKQRRYSQTKWDANQWKKYENNTKRFRNTQSPTFNNKFNTDYKSKMGQSRNFYDSIMSEDDNFYGKSYCHSKSFRIQLQKNKNRRRRKDSYKVKIITTHQYEMDDINPKDLFQKYDISNSDQSKSNHQRKNNKRKLSKKKQFEQKMHNATQKARQILKGYLNRRKESRK